MVLRINGKNRGKLRISVTAGSIIILLIYSSMFYFRFDLTDSKIYSLTKISRSIYREIPHPVSITYFKTEGIERIFPGVVDVEGLLDEFEKSSKGRITIRTMSIKLENGSEIPEDEGIIPQTVKIVKDNSEKTVKVYSSVRIQFLDRTKILNNVFSASNLEYRIVTAVRELVQNRRRTVGILVGDRSRSLADDYSILVETLSMDFDLIEIKRGDTANTSINILLVLGNRDLTEDDVGRIAGFIESGGNVLFAVDGVFVDLNDNLAAEPVKDNPLLDLLDEYGIRIKNTLVLDPFSRNFRIPRIFYGNIAWKTVGPYPEWIEIKKAAETGNPVVADFTGVDLLWASPVILKKEAAGNAEVLFYSSTMAWEMGPPFLTDPYKVNEYGSGKKLYKSAIPLGISVVRGSSRMIIVGDSDFLSDLLSYSDSLYNMRFLLNSVDWLSQNEDFMAIRTRMERNLSLDALPDDRKQAVYRSAQILNLFIIPVIIFIVMIIVIRGKKKRNES